MTTAYEIASHIRSRHKFSGEIQMHKLLYYAQAWSLAWDGAPLFEDRIEAWKNGPVVPSLRHTTVIADGTCVSLTSRRPILTRSLPTMLTTRALLLAS